MSCSDIQVHVALYNFKKNTITDARLTTDMGEISVGGTIPPGKSAAHLCFSNRIPKNFTISYTDIGNKNFSQKFIIKSDMNPQKNITIKAIIESESIRIEYLVDGIAIK